MFGRRTPPENVSDGDLKKSQKRSLVVQGTAGFERARYLQT